MIENKVISLLRENPLTLKELGENIDFSEVYIRKTMDYLHRLSVVQKDIKNRRVVYSLRSDYRRYVPLIKADRNGLNDKGLFTLVDLLNNYKPGANTIHRSARFFYQVFAQLLNAGAKHQHLKETVSIDTPEYRKQVNANKNELRLLKVEVERNIQVLENHLTMLKIIRDGEEYWNLETLAGHFAHQIDPDTNGVIQPLISTAEILSHPLNAPDD